MRTQQCQLLTPARLLNDVDHRLMECIERSERPARPCAFRDPRRVFENPAERLDEAVTIACVQIREIHWVHRVQ
jgi:hypothetical protein